MKYLKYLSVLGLLVSFFWPVKIQAEEKEPIRIYVFYSSTCSACQSANSFFNSFERDNSDIKVYYYEITDNEDKIMKAEKVLKKNFYVVPWIIIGNKSFTGWMNSNSPSLINSAVDYYRNHDYTDVLGIELGITKPSHNQNNNNKEEENDNDIIKVPVFGNVNIKDLSLPLLSLVLGAIDGFNPCAMWVLLFLITMLLGMKDKKKMWVLGIAFLLTSAFVYLLFMVSWLKFLSYAESIIYMRILISLVALVGGIINIKNYFNAKNKDGCVVITAKKRKSIFAHINKLTNQKRFYLALIGIITLALTVNMVELACSLGIPVIFIQILEVNHLSNIEYSLYMGMYLLTFMLDDLIIFVISMLTLNVTSVSTKYGKYTHLIGGVIMILIGILLVFKPEWLAFNFK